VITPAAPPHDGRCTCGQVRFRVLAEPLIVHACHCTWCQRESGTAFALNAMVETAQVELLQGAPETVMTPSASGQGQQVRRCPACRVALWSHYAGGGTRFAFVRVGTLAEPARLPPDVHIFTSTRQPWLQLPDGPGHAPQFERFYDRAALWRPQALARRAEAMAAPAPTI